MLSYHSNISMYMQEMNITNTKFLKLVSLSLSLSQHIHKRLWSLQAYESLVIACVIGRICKSTIVVDLQISNDKEQFAIETLMYS